MRLKSINTFVFDFRNGVQPVYGNIPETKSQVLTSPNKQDRQIISLKAFESALSDCYLCASPSLTTQATVS